MSDPYTQEDYQAINDNLRKLNEAQAALDKAVAAGVNCAEWPEICRGLTAQYEKLKSVYFPNKP